MLKRGEPLHLILCFFNIKDSLICLADDTFPPQGCTAAFTSIMGYMYHMKKCGKKESELEKMLLSCCHCGKTYKSKAGLEYHLKSEHAPVSLVARHVR